MNLNLDEIKNMFSMAFPGPMEWREYPDPDRLVLCRKDNPAPLAYLQARDDMLCIKDPDDGHLIKYLQQKDAIAIAIAACSTAVPELIEEVERLRSALSDIIAQHPNGYECRITEIAREALAGKEKGWRPNHSR